jgi:tRNA-2-methylthio-N6-dimethylallyladenosine synthase
MPNKIKKYNITTIGCQMNKSDSERIAGYLEMLGYQKAKKEEKTDLEIFTTCGVRQSAEDRIYGLVPRVKRRNPEAKIILTGCLSLRPDVKKRLEDKVDIWLPIGQLPDLAGMIGERNIKLTNENYLSTIPRYASKFSAFVPIGNGCDNFCAYCVVPYARGREVYRPVKEIIDEIEDLSQKGYKEVNLIAQNVNSYRSGKDDFPDLLKLANDINGDFWIRFATSHPKDMSEKLIKTIAESEKICKHIHLPAQAGDDEILRRMNRKYTKAQYLELIKKIRSSMPIAAVTTDIIVGFPGETKKQFDNTRELFEEAKFDMAYIARYSPRPGTAAFGMEDDVLAREKKEREEILMDILRKTALLNSKQYEGKIFKLLLEKKNSKGVFGRTDTNKNVLIKNSRKEVGEFDLVKIIKAESFGLMGEGVLD